MKKNKKPLTDAQREAKRERDRKYRAAKKAAKVKEVKKPVANPAPAKKPTAAKKPEAKKVAKPIKTPLPKPTAAVVEPRRVHIIKPGDAIHFDGFTAEKLITLATGIVCETAIKDHQRRLAEALKEFTHGGGKHNKKEAKK